MGIFGVARDVTERKNLEAQLLQSQKMEAVGQLAGGVAHDFNNLLMVIRGYVDLMGSRARLDDGLKDNLNEIRKAADRATSLTQQLLAFSRKQVLHPELLDLNYVVSIMEKMLRRLIGENIELVTRTARQAGRVKADPVQIEQVILNLALNARDAMAEGGRLTLETDNVELDADFVSRQPGSVPGSYVLLRVSDTGAGMDPATVAHIFEPFFTTKEKGKGTGLGLATVYGIVKQSGGYVVVTSQEGVGTTIEIYLPRADESTAAMEDAEVPEGVHRGSETILVVEDEEAVCKLSCEFLSSRGYNVLAASDGLEALQVSEQHRGPIHLLLTDVVMPGINGQELARRLSPLKPEMKIMYIPGYTDNAIAQKFLVDPGTVFLQKPFPLDTLARNVREVLEGRFSGR